MQATDDMTLEQLEKEIWPEPKYTSHLVTTCHQSRNKRLGDYCVEDFRIMLGQSIGAFHLLPRAIEILRKDPFAEGDFFEGDLLVAIARHPENFSLLAPKDVMHLRTACETAAASTDPKLREPNLSLVESLIAKLYCKARK
ncbi:MAG: contact-dependent growth inhibition system immunity protein [Paracoccaceae bacterium]|nr:contact-dependent growth inhibition system immunity protein [Paracoccaceae bacterium]